MNVLANDFFDCKSDIKISETLSLTYYRDEMKVLYRQSTGIQSDNLGMFFIYDNNLMNDIYINDGKYIKE